MTASPILYPAARATLRAQLHRHWNGQCASRRRAVPSRRGHVPCSSLFATATLKEVDGDDAPIIHRGSHSSDTRVRRMSTNANPSEVNKFSSFASNWWDARSNPLVGMNPIRINFMRQVVDNFQPSSSSESSTDANASQFHLPLRDKRILDIGCGGGLLTESLSRLGASLVVGVDASPAVVEVAKMHSFHGNSRLSPYEQQSDRQIANPGGGGIRYIGGTTVEELATRWLSEREKEQQSTSSPSDQPREHELFDVVTALEVIEHVPDPASLLRAASSLLKPNGILFVSTINRTMKSYGLAIVAAEYLSGKVPVGTHDWNKFRSPDEVERMVCGTRNDADVSNNTAMKQVALGGMVIEPPFVNLKWSLDSSDVDVNWIGAYQKQR